MITEELTKELRWVCLPCNQDYNTLQEAEDCCKEQKE